MSTLTTANAKQILTNVVVVEHADYQSSVNYCAVKGGVDELLARIRDDDVEQITINGRDARKSPVLIYALNDGGTWEFSTPCPYGENLRVMEALYVWVTAESVD